jgi:hypothetical protein
VQALQHLPPADAKSRGLSSASRRDRALGRSAGAVWPNLLRSPCIPRRLVLWLPKRKSHDARS